MAVLPTPGSPMSTALFFVRRQSTCWTRSISMWRPTSGSSWFFIAASVRSRLNSASSGVSFTRVSVVFSLSSATMSSRTVLSRIPFSMQDGRRDRTLFAQDPEQQVLGADVVVQQPIGFFGRELQDALGFGAEGDLDRGRDLLAEHRAPFDFLADAFERQMRARKDPARQPLALADQSQQEVLGLNGDAAELAGFVAREEEHAPRSFRVAFEHPVTYVEEDSPRVIIRQWQVPANQFFGLSESR